MPRNPPRASSESFALRFRVTFLNRLEQSAVEFWREVAGYSKLVMGEEEETGQHLEQVNPVTNIGMYWKLVAELLVIVENTERASAASMEPDRSHDGC